jgi:hypothetical protein
MQPEYIYCNILSLCVMKNSNLISGNLLCLYNQYLAVGKITQAKVVSYITDDWFGKEKYGVIYEPVSTVS